MDRHLRRWGLEKRENNTTRIQGYKCTLRISGIIEYRIRYRAVLRDTKTEPLVCPYTPIDGGHIYGEIMGQLGLALMPDTIPKQ